MSLLTRKPVVLLLGVLAGILVLAASRAVWVTGIVTDVAGPTAAQATGSEAAPGLPGLALVAIAAAVAAVTSGRVGRVVAVVVLGVVALALVVLVGRAVADPAGVLGSVAGARTGGGSPLGASGGATAWPWLVVLAAAILLLAAAGTTLARHRWRALGADPEGAHAGTARDATGRRGARSDWERLSDGEDPTVRDGREGDSRAG